MPLDSTRRLARLADTSPRDPRARVIEIGSLAAEPRLWWGLAGIFSVVQIVLAARAHHLDTPQIWGGLDRFLHGSSPYAVVTHLPYGYDHPPGSTLIDAPLGLMSVSLAGRVIVIVSGLACMLAVVLMGAVRPQLAPWRIGLAAFIVSISRPFHEELTLGNIELLALAPMVLGLFAIERGRERLGGTLLGLGATIKPTAAVAMLAPALARRWRASAAALALFAAITLIGFAIVPHSWRFFTSVVPFLTGPEQAHADYNASFTGIVEYAGLGSSTPVAVTQGLALLAVLAVILRYRRVLAGSLQLSVALLVVAILLVPRHSFEVYGLYLILAFPVILSARGRQEIALAAVAVWFLAIRDVIPLHGSVVGRFRELRPGLGHLALAALTVIVLERTRRADEIGEGGRSSGARAARPARSRTPRRRSDGEADRQVGSAGVGAPDAF